MDDIQLETPGSEITHCQRDPTNLRRAAPAIAMAWFAVQGMNCSLPLEPEPFDLLVKTATGIDRVQVKSTTYRDPRGKYMAAIGKRRAHGPNKNRLLPYRTDEVDHFFIIDGDFNIYYIPVGDIGGKVYISLPAWNRFLRGSLRMVRATGVD